MSGDWLVANIGSEDFKTTHNTQGPALVALLPHSAVGVKHVGKLTGKQEPRSKSDRKLGD
jgi:hypothetical protein